MFQRLDGPTALGPSVRFSLRRALSFDKDGTGAAAKVRFANLDDGLAMSSQEFLIV